MPHYFFNVRNGVSIIKDRIGMYLPDLKAAREQGHRLAEDVVGGLLEQPNLFKGLHVDICDETGLTLQMIELPRTETYKR